MRSIWPRVDHRRHAHSLLKIRFAKLEKNSVKRIPFEIDENNITLASPEFPLTDSDHGDNKQDEIEILTV